MRVRWAFLLVLAVGVPVSAWATWQKWLIRPEYEWIGYYSEAVFKAKKDGKVQLFDFEGRALLPQPADSVTDYSDGFALVLAKEKRGYRITGTLAEQDLAFCAVEKPCYTERFSYCSEGFISVADAKGKQGYLGARGNLVFSCQFREARPFRKGWASVSLKEGEAHYIDPYGNTLPINIKTTDASSFNAKGEALAGNYQKLLIINTSGEVVRKYTMEDGQTEPPVRPYDYVYDEHPQDFEPQHNSQPNGEMPFQWKNENGLWGIMVTCEGDFHVTLTPEMLTLTPSEPAPEMAFTLDLPNGFGQDYTLFFDNGDGVERPVSLMGNRYAFTPSVGQNAKSVTLRWRLMSGGVLQWQDERTIPIRTKDTLIEVGPPFATSQYADANDRQRVKAVVTNDSDFPVEVSTSIEAVLPAGSGNRVVSKSAPSQRLAAGEKMECGVTFQVTDEERVKVIVIATQAGKVLKRNEATITLRPFY